MKKKQWMMIILFFIIGLLYDFENFKLIDFEQDIQREITIYVEGKVNTIIEFNDVPTVLDVFNNLKIENNYQFNPNKKLENNQTLYIPINNNLIHLNSATIEQLMEVPGIGEVTAKKIIDYRSIQAFEVIEDIQKVSGIGYKKYLSIRSYLCI